MTRLSGSSRHAPPPIQISYLSIHIQVIKTPKLCAMRPYLSPAKPMQTLISQKGQNSIQTKEKCRSYLRWPGGGMWEFRMVHERNLGVGVEAGVSWASSAFENIGRSVGCVLISWVEEEFGFTSEFFCGSLLADCHE